MQSRHVLPRDPQQPRFVQRIEQIDDVRIVRLCGDIDQETVEEGHRYIIALNRDGERIDTHLLLDCALVGHVDFSAVALLVLRMQDYLAAGRQVALEHCDRRLKTYIELAELSPRIRIFDSEEEALATLQAINPRKR